MTMYTLLISRQLLFERIEWATKEDLIRYLKESGIPCKCKERKAALVTKALASIETELDMERIAKYVYLASWQVREVVDISKEELTELVKAGKLIVDKRYRSNQGQGKGYLFRADKVMDYIDPSRPFKNSQPLNGSPSMSAWEFSRVTGRPLPEVLHDMTDGSIPYEWIDGDRRIPFSYLYPTLYK